MYCSKCGQYNENGSQFCRTCGNSLINNSQTQNIVNNDVVSDEEFEKKLRGTKWFSITLSVINSITLLAGIYLKNWYIVFLELVIITVLILFYVLTKKRMIAGPIIGIVLGILYIMSFNIISIALGIVVILDSIVMYKYISNKNKN